MKAYEWIDRAKAKNKIESDYAIAKRIGMTQSAVSRLRTTNSTLREDYAIEVARLCGIDPYIVLLDQAKERTNNECVRDAWSRLGMRIDFTKDALVF